MKDLIMRIAQSLVDNPDKVEVTEVIGEQTSVIGLRVSKEDLGKVIGKQGRTAASIRFECHGRQDAQTGSSGNLRIKMVSMYKIRKSLCLAKLGSAVSMDQQTKEYRTEVKCISKTGSHDAGM